MLSLLASLSFVLTIPPQAAVSAATDTPRGLRRNEPGAQPGFTLFSPLRSGTTFLIDMEGNEVHSWKSELPPLSMYLLDDGRLLRGSRIDENPTFFGGGLGGRIRELAPDGSVTWEYVLSDENRTLHHDFEPLPNGNVLAIAWERLSKEEALALGRKPEAIAEQGLWPDWVLEIEPTRPSGGRIVWEWHAKDHLIQDLDPAKPNYGSPAEHPERIDVNAGVRAADRPLTDEEREAEEQREAEMRALGYAGGDEEEDEDEKGEEVKADWLHTNSIDYHAGHDLILLSTPHLSEIWIIDHSTTTAEARGKSGGRWKKGGDLLYRWGNAQSYRLGSAEDQQLFYQHQPEWVPEGMPGAGNVTIFNNGSKRPVQEYSSIDELVLPFDPKQGFRREAGKPFGPAQPLWSYSDPGTFFSFFISGCQRLPNGNTLVCSGKQGIFFEVTPDKKVVWEYWNPHGGELAMGMGNAAPRPPGDDGKDPPPTPVEPTSCFRATRILPSHPGLKALGIE